MRKIYNPPLLPLISIVAIIYFIYYLWWRVTATLNPECLFFSWLLLAAEAFGVFCYILFAWFTHNIAPLVPHKNPAPGLRVDIFVPTYNEDLDILQATLIGCRLVRYPHTTYVLDDGNRPPVQVLAARLGCKYIARPTHEHAKAGNINYALQHTDGEFIVVLDADMVPQPEYLHRTLGYFEDEQLALVQLPQEFYNQDSIQHAANETSWHEQALFFRVIQPGKNYTNSAFWCGSPSVIRRKALLAVGGVATETITEDIHTTVRLHSQGWKTLFVNEPLAYGIAPQTIQAFLVQRLRWAQGTMQLYRSKESPLWIPGLNLAQRLSYLSSFLAYFESYQKFILFSIPILVLGFDIFPLSVGFESFILHWGPYFALNIVANQMGGRGVFNYFKTERYNLLKTIIFIQSTLTLISRKPLAFKVTPKTVNDSVYRQERRAMIGYMIVFGSLLAAIVYGLVCLLLPQQHAITWDSFVIAFLWGTYDAYIIFLALREVFQKRHERKYYRFPDNAEGIVQLTSSCKFRVKAQVLNLSIRGAGLLADPYLLAMGETLSLKVRPKGFSDVEVGIGKVTSQSHHPSGKTLLGVVFSEERGSERDSLFEYLFIHKAKMEEQGLYHVNEWDPSKLLLSPSR